MNQSEIIIDLTFRRKDWEDIYFINNYQNMFISPMTWRSFIAFIFTLVLLIGSYAYSIQNDKYAWLIFISAILTLGTLINYLYRLNQLLKWRRSVVLFLDANERVKIHKLILSDKSLTFRQDETEVIVKWESFKKILVTNSYIKLFGDEIFLFPKKSMIAEDYTNFIEQVNVKIKNGL
jgi:hypothetical protein